MSAGRHVNLAHGELKSCGEESPPDHVVKIGVKAPAHCPLNSPGKRRRLNHNSVAVIPRNNTVNDPFTRADNEKMESESPHTDDSASETSDPSEGKEYCRDPLGVDMASKSDGRHRVALAIHCAMSGETALPSYKPDD